jgi:hypothetical protein
MQLPAPKWFATIYAVLFGIALVASILGAAGILVAVPLAILAWFLVKIMFFGLALVIAALAVLALASNLIPSSVPVTKQRVHFQLTPGEARLDEGATFAPIEVYGPGGYSVTVHPEGGPDNLPRTQQTPLATERVRRRCSQSDPDPVPPAIGILRTASAQLVHEYPEPSNEVRQKLAAGQMTPQETMEVFPPQRRPYAITAQMRRAERAAARSRR